MPLPLEVPENCPKTFTAPSRFFSVCAPAWLPNQSDETARKRRRKRERDRDRLHISLATLLRVDIIFQPKEIAYARALKSPCLPLLPAAKHCAHPRIPQCTDRGCRVPGG